MQPFTRSHTFSLSLVSSLSWISFAALPYELAFITSTQDVTVGAAAYLASAELIVLACSTSWFGRSIAGRDKRLLTVNGLALAAAANAACLIFDNALLFFVARLAVGAGLGMVAAATNALPALQPRPERLFGLMATGLSLVFAAMMFSIPVAITFMGGKGLFAVELVFIIVIGGLSVLLPRGISAGGVLAVPARSPLPTGSLNTLFGLAVMEVGQGACWAFAERAGEAQHIVGVELGGFFTISALVSLVGALGATTLGLRWGHKIPLFLGYLLQVFVAVGIYCVTSRGVYIASLILANAAGTFTIPYVQGILAELDGTGRAAALSGASVNFGAAMGPAISAALMIIPGLFPIGISIVGMAVVSIGLVALGGRRIIFRTRGIGREPGESRAG